MSLKTQVEAYVGTVTDTTALDQYLTDSAKILVDVIPPDKIDAFLAMVTIDPSAGVACDNYRVMYAALDTRRAARVTPDLAGMLGDASSLMRATAFSPRYYILDGKCFIMPAAGSALYFLGMAYPTVLNSATDIPNFPHPLIPAVVLDAASRVVSKKVVDFIVSTLSTLAFNEQPAPTPPTLATISVEDAAAAGVTAPVWDAFGTPPTFTAPTITLPTKPSAFSTTATPPAAPASPSYTYTDAQGATIAGVTIAALPSAPTFTYGSNNLLPAASTAPTVDFSDLVVPTAPSAPSLSYSDANAATISTISFGSLGTPPAYTYASGNLLPANSTLTQPDLSALTVPTVPAAPTSTDIPYTAASVDATLFTSVLDISTQLTALTASLDTSQDIELGRAKIEEIQFRIQKFLQESELNIKTTLSKNQLTTDANLKNATQVLTQGVQIYQNKLAQYSQNLDSFKNTMQRQVSDYQLKQADFQLKAQFAVQDALHKFEAAQVAYQANLQVVLETARVDAARVQAQAQLTTEVALKNELETIGTAVQQYTATLERYKVQMQGYQIQVQARIAQYQISLDIYKTKAEVSIQDAKARWENDMAAYQAAVQRNLKQSEIDIQKALQQASITTDVDVKNRAEQLAKQVQEYQAKLQSFSTSMDGYKTQVQAEVEVFQANLTLWTKDADNLLNKYQADIANAKAEFEAEVIPYQASVQKAIEKAKMDLERVLAVAKMETDVEVANMQAGYEAAVAGNKNLLELFADKIQSYQIDVQQEIGRFSNVLQQLMAEVKSWTERGADLRMLYTTTLQMYLGIPKEQAAQ